MSTTCARKGCRKKATYTVLLTRLPIPEDEQALQRWPLCPEDRDRVQMVIANVLEGTPNPAKVAAEHIRTEFAAKLSGFQAELDKEDGALRAQIARSATSSEAAKHATVPPTEESESTPVTPEAPVALPPGGRPVARPGS